MSLTRYAPFGHVLRDLLVEAEFTTRIGNPRWADFADRLPGVHYETLRKAVTGERQPTAELMELSAQALGLEPDVFVEYRLWQARRSLDPRDVGHHAAVKTLRAWEGHLQPKPLR